MNFNRIIRVMVSYSAVELCHVKFVQFASLSVELARRILSSLVHRDVELHSFGQLWIMLERKDFLRYLPQTIETVYGQGKASMKERL